LGEGVGEKAGERVRERVGESAGSPVTTLFTGDAIVGIAYAGVALRFRVNNLGFMVNNLGLIT
jgi:hypothetical protein